MAFNFFKKKKNKSTEETPPKTGQYYDLTIKELIQETEDAITIVFQQPERAITYLSGQFLTLIVSIKDKEVRRAYSLSSSSHTEEDLAVTVKRVEGGLMSNYLPDTLKVGDTLKVMEPMGTFTTEHRPENKRHVVMFAGGSGITPMMSIIKSLLVKEPESIVSLVYANRNIDSIIFREALAKMETDNEGRLHVVHILDDAPMNWQGYSGLLNHDMLVKLFQRIPDWGIEDTTYLMCGPEGMMNNVGTLLAAHNIPKDKIFKESFVSGIIGKDTKAKETALTDRKVTIHFDGEEHVLEVASDSTILETALDQGIDLPYSCQSGLCTACRGKCISGKVKLDEEEGLSEEELSQGYVLTCVGHPLTDGVVIEIG